MASDNDESSEPRVQTIAVDGTVLDGPPTTNDVEATIETGLSASLADTFLYIAATISKLHEARDEQSKKRWLQAVWSLLGPATAIVAERERIAHECPNCKGPKPGDWYE